MSTPSVDVIALPRALTLVQQCDFPHKLGLCERLFGRGLSHRQTCWVQTAAGIPWKLDLANPTHRWIVYGKYEGSAFLNWAKRFVRPESTVVDSGANIGQMLLYLAQWTPRGRVLAFEPCAEAAAWIAECLSVNPDLPVEILRLALGDQAEDLFLETKGGGELHGACNQISETTGAPVKAVRLDTTLAEWNVDRIDLWKLDVEGHELPALRGADSLLMEHRIGALYVELAFGNGQRIVDYLRTFGYRGYLFNRAGRLSALTILPEHTNALFLPVGLEG